MSNYTAVRKATETLESLYITQGSFTPSKFNRQCDKEIAEFVINAIQTFFEKNCQNSIVDFSPLGQRPLTIKTCERALELIQLFEDRIVLKRWNVEASHYCHEVSATVRRSSSEYISNQPPPKSKLEISMFAYDALQRHTESLQSNGDNLDKKVPFQNPYECSVQHSFHEVDLKYTTQTKLISKTRNNNPEKSCYDQCTLF